MAGSGATGCDNPFFITTSVILTAGAQSTLARRKLIASCASTSSDVRRGKINRLWGDRAPFPTSLAMVYHDELAGYDVPCRLWGRGQYSW